MSTPLTFQQRVAPWMDACFGPEISGDKLERGDRFLEEALELLQSGDYPRERVAALTDYVFDRPQGEINQEVGGVMVTLAAYCLAFGLDMHAAGETELARIWTKVEKIRAKQAAKPTGSALPVASKVGGEPPKPRRAFVLDLKVEADDLDSLLGYLRSFETDLYLNRISTGVSGGYSAGSQYSLSIDETITHDSWAEALEKYIAWMDARDASKENADG